MREMIDLGNGLVLRSVRNAQDARNYAVFNGEFNNAREGATCACVLNHHPFTSFSDYRIVEDTRSGHIVSTTCTFPWEVQFETLRLQAAMLEMVLTHPDYRRLGLVRRQVEYFHQDAVERGADFTIIWGIPYYYRQFGYAYCLEGETAEVLPAFQIPEALVEKTPGFRMRPAELSDIPTLDGLYQRALQGVDVWVTRTPAYWQYLIQWARYPIQVVEHSETGDVLGYVVYVQSPRKIRIFECNFDNQQAALAYLGFLKTQEITELSIAWPESGMLARAARSLGSRVLQGGQWLVRIPDAGNFIWKIRPLLESRLVNAGLQGLCISLVINLYHHAWRIRIEHGKVTEIKPLGFVNAAMGSDGGDLCIPADAFVRLVFGFRSLAAASGRLAGYSGQGRDPLAGRGVVPSTERSSLYPVSFHGIRRLILVVNRSWSDSQSDWMQAGKINQDGISSGLYICYLKIPASLGTLPPGCVFVFAATPTVV